MCMHIQSSLNDRFFWQISCVCIFSQAIHDRFSWQISCVCIFSQAFMTDISGRFLVYAYSVKPSRQIFLAEFMCMHIQSSLNDRFFWQISCVCIFSQAIHDRFSWQISCICIFSQAFMTDFSGRFHVYAYLVKPLWQISCVRIFSQVFMTYFSGRFPV